MSAAILRTIVSQRNLARHTFVSRVAQNHSADSQIISKPGVSVSQQPAGPVHTSTAENLYVFSTWCKLISYTSNVRVSVCGNEGSTNDNTHTLSTWLHLHNPLTVSPFYGKCNSDQFPWLSFFSVKGCWKCCSLMRGCELWCALTAWPIRLMASLRPDFRPVEGELSTAPREPLPFMLRAGKLPRGSAREESRPRTEWIYRTSFSRGKKFQRPLSSVHWKDL